MKKIIIISLGGALCIASLLVMNHMSKPKPHPMDKPLAEWLRMEAMPKSEQRQEHLIKCVCDIGVASPTSQEVKACYKEAGELYPTIPFENYSPPLGNKS